MSEHPDYGADPATEQGKPCVCGGIRYWHGALGCDDCDCTEFVEEGDVLSEDKWDDALRWAVMNSTAYGPTDEDLAPLKAHDAALRAQLAAAEADYEAIYADADRHANARIHAEAERDQAISERDAARQFASKAEGEWARNQERAETAEAERDAERNETRHWQLVAGTEQRARRTAEAERDAAHDAERYIVGQMQAEVRTLREALELVDADLACVIAKTHGLPHVATHAQRGRERIDAALGENNDAT